MKHKSFLTYIPLYLNKRTCITLSNLMLLRSNLSSLYVYIYSDTLLVSIKAAVLGK